jgi:hypothetical protein
MEFYSLGWVNILLNNDKMVIRQSRNNALYCYAYLQLLQWYLVYYDSSVGVMPKLQAGRPRNRRSVSPTLSVRQDISNCVSKPLLEPTQTLFFKRTTDFFPGVKRPRRATDHSPHLVPQPTGVFATICFRRVNTCWSHPELFQRIGASDSFSDDIYIH